MANNADPDPTEAVWSGFTLIDQACLYELQINIVMNEPQRAKLFQEHEQLSLQ